MADFTGMSVLVRMSEPPNFAVEGKVMEVVPGKYLTLQNGE